MAIEVTDDGAGIAADDVPHVFDRLYRTDESRTRGTGGSGLGLSIARAVVAAHGGTIEVASDGLGRGTTVRITLPAGSAERDRCQPVRLQLHPQLLAGNSDST